MNDNIKQITDHLTSKLIDAHMDETQCEIMTMMALRKRAEDIIHIAKGMRDIGSHKVADALYHAIDQIHDAVIMIGAACENKQQKILAELKP